MDDRRRKNIFNECLTYKVLISSDMINYYLPHRLAAYSANTRRNFLRRMYFFSKLFSQFTRTPFDDYIDQIHQTVSLNYFLKKLFIENNSKIRYNFVILDDYLIFIRVPHQSDQASHMFCKHITIAGRAKYARFAGEIWCDQYKNYLVNNNSGTYRPSDQLIDAAVGLFQYLAPHVHFQGTSFRFS